MKHLRLHFGPKAFVSRAKVRMLSEGHTEVKVGRIEYALEEGEITETIEFSYKDIATELTTMIEAKLSAAKLNCNDVQIQRVDFIGGGDHGAGAFQAGCKVVIVYRSTSDGEERSIVFDVAIAEVICRNKIHQN